VVARSRAAGWWLVVGCASPEEVGTEGVQWICCLTDGTSSARVQAPQMLAGHFVRLAANDSRHEEVARVRAMVRVRDDHALPVRVREGHAPQVRVRDGHAPQVHVRDGQKAGDLVGMDRWSCAHAELVEGECLSALSQAGRWRVEVAVVVQVHHWQARDDCCSFYATSMRAG